MPGLAAIVAMMLLLVSGGKGWAAGIAVLLFFAALALGVYRKRIAFDPKSGGVEVTTRTLFSTRKAAYPPTNAKLKVQRIHIRLAENCGAIDLVLPDQSLRLRVDGSFDRSAAAAKQLSELSGIPMANSG